MAWILLVIAGLFEVVWALALKASHNFTQLVPSIIMLVGMVISVWLLSVALKTLPVGTGYAVWTGIGALGTVILGIVLFGESASLPKLFFAALLIIGILGLKFVAPE
ncbi:quaternary ammonium compound efflux SMR transporter SugE [Ktedonosporobacter rubrisoli]|uniref:Quaternary ammonium compound efflux SMR transporter SugE n=1 Tax=Ktedonosporobacter rubrisoli TaxID=2509675 RepID=A0A4P6JIK8_KTERU|nr:quaternary ammonium compound efflux SMR transporter SugE [Ktedonosporobacter rubrisoli]QBD74740.1 quaternary ammonium compound efflux SMR transporter SugE [Ktedonosporobacter rubrisoli]